MMLADLGLKVLRLVYSGALLLFLLLLLVVFVVMICTAGFFAVDLHLVARPLKLVLGIEHALL